MHQNEYSTARPTLKRWSYGNQTFEPRGPDQRQNINIVLELIWTALNSSKNIYIHMYN